MTIQSYNRPTFTVAVATATALALGLSACGAGAHDTPPPETTTVRADIREGAIALVSATAEVSDRLATIAAGSPLDEAHARVRTVVAALAPLTGDVELPEPGDAAEVALSQRAGQASTTLRRLAAAVRRSPLDLEARAPVLEAIARARLAARSLAYSVGEYHAEGKVAELAAIDAITRDTAGPAERSGPLFPGSPFYVLDTGHIDAVDAAFEDGAWELSIHDESVTPDVERDPAYTIMVVKSQARIDIPDDPRFAFLGTPGAPVWLLPEGQLEAEAADILWVGLATEEIEAGVFLNDSVRVRFKQVIGPNGLSLFFSPQDELTPIDVLVDSENGLPDAVDLPVGAHTHANWAFEAPGPYVVKVDVRGRLAGVAGNPWVTSSTVLLKFVVLP